MQLTSLVSSPSSFYINIHIDGLSQTHSKKYSIPCSYHQNLSTKTLPLFNSIPFIRPITSLSSLRRTVVEERVVVETSKDELEFIEIGYISNVHGIQGELRVKPSTDFAELRFSNPGKRWLKERVSGKETIREVELAEGREHSGQGSWIISFAGIDTVDKAKHLVGSVLLVREEEDRPTLEEGEFYTPDLIGMRVILKDTGEPVGKVVKVFNNGGNDLLQVMLNSGRETDDVTSTVKAGEDVAAPLVWVPFVEAIVPDVDISRREMQITPPRGLLQLNLRSDVRSKKERRQSEWKERKRATQRLIAAKKKLSEMEQRHVFDGLGSGDKSQKRLLADQIVGINFKWFQQAMQNSVSPSKRWSLFEFINAHATKIPESYMKTSKELETIPSSTKMELNPLQEKGVNFIADGKVAIVIVTDDKLVKNSSGILHLQTVFSNFKRTFSLMAKEERIALPLIIVSPTYEIQNIQKIFAEHDYFAFDSQKVLFLEEEKLPVVSYSAEEEKSHKIFMETPWEILQSPVGSGGVFSLLSSNNSLGNLVELGIEYVQVLRLGQRSVIGDPLFLGFTSSRGADIGIKINNKNKDFEEDYDMVFSTRFLRKIMTQTGKLQFYQVQKQNQHVQTGDEEHVNMSLTPNLYEFHCSISSALNACSSDKICIMDVVD